MLGIHIIKREEGELSEVCSSCFSTCRTRKSSSIQEHWEWAACIRLTFQVCHSSRLLTLACKSKTKIHGARILLSKLEIDCNQERTVRLNVYFYINRLSCREILGLNQQRLWFSSLHGAWTWRSVKQSEYLVFILARLILTRLLYDGTMINPALQRRKPRQ